jgi:four helix bundle protein
MGSIFMLKSSRDPYGFKKLLAYQKAEQLQNECSLLTSHFPKNVPLAPLKTLSALSDQMNRSARSVKQNIVEGWKRNSTKEYYEFLGFSIGANTELEEDCNDIWKGIYPELMGEKGLMGNFIKREKGDGGRGKENPLNSHSLLATSHLSPLNSNSVSPTSPLTSLNSHSTPFDIEKLKFYPLDPSLPPVVQLKLRCKELNFLLSKLQKSLIEKMKTEGTIPISEKLKIKKDERAKGDKWEEKMLEEQGLVKLENGRVVKKER